MSDDDQRPAALLTDAQRAYLRGEKDYRPSVQRDIDRRIRERLRASMMDFSLLLRKFPAEQIEKSLEIRELGDRGDPGDLALEIGVADAIGIAHLAYRDRDLGKSEGEFIAGRTEKGIRQALNRLGKSVRNVDVSIDVDIGADIDSFADMSPEELAEFSVQELQQVFREDRITSDQFIEALEEKGLALKQEE